MKSVDLQQSFSAGVRKVLDLVDDLRKIGVQEEVPIPQIAVMGDQSSGKSSVLEAISGIPFPRGSGLVTRCATQLTMSRGDTWKAEICAGEKTVIVSSKEEIAVHIEAMTTSICGGDSGFCSEKSIEIKLEAPDCPDLTIIDLPGIVRTHTAGQDKSVKDDVNKLIQKYLKEPRTIILAVIGANVDIATNEIIERAAEVDPDGLRTMGVLTKPDLVDKGSEHEVIEVLSNHTKPLNHGYVMVKNRSQTELDAAASIEQARKSELEYFKNSPYSKHPDHRLGVDALTTALTELLVAQINNALPSMVQEIDAVIKRTSAELSTMGANPDDARQRRSACNKLIRDLSDSLKRVTTADYREVGDDRVRRVLQAENAARKSFAASVTSTRPGFEGQDDVFEIEVTETYDDDDGDDIRLEGVKHHSEGKVLTTNAARKSSIREMERWWSSKAMTIKLMVGRRRK